MSGLAALQENTTYFWFQVRYYSVRSGDDNPPKSSNVSEINWRSLAQMNTLSAWLMYRAIEH